MGIHRSALHSPQLLAICVTLGKCLPLSDSQLPNEQHETGGQKLLAMTPSWFLQKSKTLLDTVPNEEGTPANRPLPPTTKQNQACLTSFHSPGQTLVDHERADP